MLTPRQRWEGNASASIGLSPCRSRRPRIFLAARGIAGHELTRLARICFNSAKNTIPKCPNITTATSLHAAATPRFHQTN
jgi:hypothetical protein